MKGIPLLIALIVLPSAFVPESAQADIYYYVNRDGVACFTDAPTTSEAVVVIKEPTRPGGDTSKRMVPTHLAATGIGKKPKAEGIVATTDSPAISLPIRGKFTSLNGLRHDPFDGALRMHNGVDIAAPQGTPIKATQPGTVIFSGTRPGYGNMIVLEHADRTMTVYAHNLLNLKTEGEYAGQGDTIALLGSTGRSTGPHLHFEAWRDGINITSSYTGTGAVAIDDGVDSNRIRMSISPDGSLLLTNLN